MHRAGVDECLRAFLAQPLPRNPTRTTFNKAFNKAFNKTFNKTFNKAFSDDHVRFTTRFICSSLNPTSMGFYGRAKRRDQ